MTETALGVRAFVRRATEDAFSPFYADTWPDLFAFAATLTGGDLAAAEEVAQESLVRVWGRFDRLDDPRPYAFRVAANLVKRRWAQGRREPVTDPALLPDAGSPARHDHTVDAVRRLPPRLREVVVLHYYADLPVDTVAAQLRRPVGTVKRRLHEARALLAVALGEEP